MTSMPLRVMVQDAWDEVRLQLPAATSLAELKRQALTAARVAGDPDAYLLKFRGAELADESRDRKSTRLNSSHIQKSRMPSSA